MKNIFLLSFCLIASNAFAQTTKLYIPLDIQKAYKNGTRSYDGKPGAIYWQNRADYKIFVDVNPQTRLVSGSETIAYYNNSPDTLKRLVIRLYQDFFKKGAQRDFQIKPDDLTDGVDVQSFIINGDTLVYPGSKPSVRRDGTNMFVRLKKSMKPGDTLFITTEWNFTIAKQTPIRMGMYDSTSAFVAYWFPQVAVYDDIDGWDEFNYGGQQEFYNDFGNFEVEISIPKNFIVWATGVLQNPNEVFTEEIMKRYQLALNSDTVVNIIKKEDIGKDALTPQTEKNIYKYKAENITDFAFAFSDHYLWDASSLLVDEKNRRRVFIGAAYKETSKDFYEVAQIARTIIDYLSKEMPCVPYPYPTMTVFNGWGGMEFPMMVNDGSTPSRDATVGLTAHEISHTYFPFYMGINERKYAWMDEGMAVALPFDYQLRNSVSNNHRINNARSYSAMAGTEMEMPIMIPSVLLNGQSYSMASYARPGLALDFLRDALGDELYKKALQEFMALWNGKHPIPYDFFFTFNRVTGEDLSWFWKPWFFENGYPDLAIKKVEVKKKKINVNVEKKGIMPIPIALKITYADSTLDSTYHSAKVWKRDNKEFTVGIGAKKQLLKIELGMPRIPDVDIENNIYMKK